ncbi:unnamed protein product, partial [Oppiella nova]
MQQTSARGPGGGRGGRERGGPGGGGGDQRACNYCKESGHILADCPVLAKRSAGGQGGRGGGGGGSGGANKCFNCDKTGHRKDDCPEPRRQRSTTGAQSTCFGCGQPGHRKDECPRGAGSSRAPVASGGSSGAPTPQKKAIVVTTYEPKELQPEGNRKRKPLFVGRPGTGTKGISIALIANHFKILIKDITVYHYDIQFECNTRPMGQAASGAVGGGAGGAGGGDRESRNKVRKLRQKENRFAFNTLMNIKRELFRNEQGVPLRPVFDGNSIFYTTGKLSKDLFTGSIEVPLDGENSRPSQVKVTVQYAQPIDLSAVNLYYDGISDTVPRYAMQALDIILRHGPTITRVPIGNSLYPKWETSESGDGSRVYIDDAGNKQVVFGHYQSTRLTKMGLTLLVDRSATAFFTGGPLVEFVKRLMDRIPRYYGNRVNEYILDYVKGLRIYTEHLGYQRPYTIDGLSLLPAHRQKFESTDAKGRTVDITVKQYFESPKSEQKAFQLDVPDTNLPCVIPKAGKVIYLPMSACHLYANQPVPRAKLTGDNTAKMVRACGTQGPFERFDAINEAVSAIIDGSQPYLQEFGLSIDSRAAKIPGRVLAKPAIQGLDRKERKKMHRPVDLKHWVLVNLCERYVTDDALRAFTSDLCWRAAHEVGMDVSNPTKIFKYDRIGRKDIDAIFEGAKAECVKKGVTIQMIMFVIPDDGDTRNTIKLVGDTKRGIVTQCVKSKNVACPPRGGVQSNLLLKINTKLGGVNRILDTDRQTGSPTQTQLADKLETSVAACIGSIDADYSQYSGSIRAQERSTKAQAVEMIMDFEGMIKELLDEYRKAQGALPNHIIYYRDGVSESQFQQVLDYELQKLRDACLAKGITAPKLTFITVQKRHHTRFRPENPQRGMGPKNNIPPGTVVDSHVVHPTDFDFYLCSHVGIQ